MNRIIESKRAHINHSFLNTLHSLQSKSTCELMLEPTTFGAVGQWPPTLPICYAKQLESLVKSPIPDPLNQIKDPHLQIKDLHIFRLKTPIFRLTIKDPLIHR